MSQFSPVAGKRTLADFIPVPQVYPVGRLDYDSEGLLLLTDDGALQHRLTDPRWEHPRTYWVQVEGTVTGDALEELRRGLRVQGFTTQPCRAQRIAEPPLPQRDPPIRYRANIPTSWIALTLTEGRNRQVRRMTAAVGFPTLRLIRVASGPLTLAGLSPAQWRDLTREEIRGIGGRL
jgi:23S rRNA pseudouridine2457 synthase